ncbi:MAG: hypothetical protein IJW14_00090 [Oscillospiraceae bacterium]|nr:hypothetical protein [Oscillospiraceae bacterium]
MKSSTKELICAVAALVIIGMLAILAGCTPVWHSKYDPGRVIYDRQGVSFDEELTAEEVAAVASVLNGKITESIFSGEYACGYGEQQAIKIGATTYYLAQDDCGCIQNGLNGRYIRLSNAEREILEGIFRAHGAEFI